MTETSPVSASPPSPNAIRLDERRLIAVAGADAMHFLHNLVTANIEALKPGSGTLAALLTPQGKIAADMLIFDASDDEPLYLIDVSHGFSEELARKLALYRLRAKVSIDLLSAPTAVMVCLDVPAITGEDFYSFTDPRSPALGQRLYGPKEALDTATSALPDGEPAIYHRRRLSLGIPEGGRDFLMLDTFPHEANMDQLGGVDFTKGCYIGQEVVSRMQHRGTARTRAAGVRFLNGFGVVGGAEITIGDKTIGRVGESFGDRAMGFIRLDRLADFSQMQQPLLAGGVPIAIEQPLYTDFKITSVGMSSYS